MAKDIRISIPHCACLFHNVPSIYLLESIEPVCPPKELKKIDSDFIGKTVVDQIVRQDYSFTTNRYMRKSPKGFWWIIFPCRFTVTPFPEIPMKQPYELMTSSLPSPSRFRYSFFRCSIFFLFCSFARCSLSRPL